MLRRVQTNTSQMLAKLFSDGMESDEVPGMMVAEDELECPVCSEEFNNSENVPLVLWCGHTLCKSCAMALQPAVVKIPVIPIEFPYFVTCPWCHFLTCRLLWKGKMKYPCKNFFLLWMVEKGRGGKMEKSKVTTTTNLRQTKIISGTELSQLTNLLPRLQGSGSEHSSIAGEEDEEEGEEEEEEEEPSVLSRVFQSLRTSKLALVLLLLTLLFCVVPVAVTIVVVYCVVSLLLVLPSFVVLYFAFPSLAWLLREIAKRLHHHTYP